MDTTKSLYKEMTHYWEQLNKRQKKVVLKVVKQFAANDNWWIDNKQRAELNKKFRDIKTPNAKEIKLDNIEKKARQAYKTRKV